MSMQATLLRYIYYLSAEHIPHIVQQIGQVLIAKSLFTDAAVCGVILQQHTGVSAAVERVRGGERDRLV